MAKERDGEGLGRKRAGKWKGRIGGGRSRARELRLTYGERNEESLKD